MSFSDAPISFPGLFGDWQFTVPSKALNIGNGIYWYGIIIAAGMLLGLYFCMKQAPKYGLSEDNIIDTVLWVIPLSIIGARIYYVLFYLDLFRNRLDQLVVDLPHLGRRPCHLRRRHCGLFDGVSFQPPPQDLLLGAGGLLRAGTFHWAGYWPLGQLYEPGSLRRGDGAPLAHAALDVGHDVYGCTPYVSL